LGLSVFGSGNYLGTTDAEQAQAEARLATLSPEKQSLVRQVKENHT